MRCFRRVIEAATLRAFTLIELMAALTVLTIIMIVTFSMAGQITGIWKGASQKIDAFENARLAFDVMTRHLAHATLNSYIDYNDPENPKYYLRKADLKFLIGPAGDDLNGDTLPGTLHTGQCIFFVGPASRTADASYSGMDSLLNVCGYYVSFHDVAKDITPQFIQSAPGGQKSRFRFSLMQLVVPSDTTGANGAVYPFPAPASKTGWQTWQTPGQYGWFKDFISSSSASRPVLIADNIIALIIRPWDPSVTSGSNANLSSHTPAAPDYIYDSTERTEIYPQAVTAHQLPPVLQVTMIAIDEVSANRLENSSSVPSVIADAMASPRFTIAANFESDLAAVEAALSHPGPGKAPVQYRIFNSTVAILGSKWTK